MEENRETQAVSEEGRDATACMAMGAGVGALGAASAAFVGVVCPLCIIVAPGLVGYGAYKKWRASRFQRKGEVNE
jgi:hypothetical protein